MVTAVKIKFSNTVTDIFGAGKSVQGIQTRVLSLETCKQAGCENTIPSGIPKLPIIKFIVSTLFTVLSFDYLYYLPLEQIPNVIISSPISLLYQRFKRSQIALHFCKSSNRFT